MGNDGEFSVSKQASKHWYDNVSLQHMIRANAESIFAHSHKMFFCATHVFLFSFIHHHRTERELSKLFIAFNKLHGSRYIFERQRIMQFTSQPVKCSVSSSSFDNFYSARHLSKQGNLMFVRRKFNLMKSFSAFQQQISLHCFVVNIIAPVKSSRSLFSALFFAVCCRLEYEEKLHSRRVSGRMEHHQSHFWAFLFSFSLPSLRFTCAVRLIIIYALKQSLQ